MLFRGGSNKHLKHLINFVDEYSLYHIELFVSHLQARMYSDSKNEEKKRIMMNPGMITITAMIRMKK